MPLHDTLETGGGAIEDAAQCFMGGFSGAERLFVGGPAAPQGRPDVKRLCPATCGKDIEINIKEKLNLICEAAHERKAEHIVVMEMGEKSSMGDFFVVMSAPSTVRVKAIVDHIEDQLKEAGLRIFHKEGLKEAQWVLLDCADVIVHVFYHELRQFYSLETLWGDAPRKPYHGA